MKIWILVSQSRCHTPEVKRFEEEMNKRKDVEYKIVIIEKFNLTIPLKNKRIVYDNKVISLPDIVIVRNLNNYQAISLVRQFEEYGVTTINTLTKTELAKNKFATLQVLSSHNIPVPKTTLIHENIILENIEKEFKYPLLLKKNMGHLGQGIILCQNASQLRDILDTFKISLLPHIQFMIQEFITHSKGKNVRVIVIGNKVIGAILKEVDKSEYKTNSTFGSKTSIYTIDKKLERISLQTAQVLGLDIAGIDFLMDKDEYKICEVNFQPMFERFEKTTQTNVAKAIIEHAITKNTSR